MSKVALRVLGITEAEADEQLFLLLMKEQGGKRHLPVLLGKRDAHGIMMAMHHVSPLRPMLYESFVSCCLQFDIQLKECYIYKMEHEVYEVFLLFEQGEQLVTVDARLGEALALAITMEAPIRVEESIINGVQNRLVMKEKESDLMKLPLEELESLMQKAVDIEDYEYASRLRDVIAKRHNGDAISEALGQDIELN